MFLKDDRVRIKSDNVDYLGVGIVPKGLAGLVTNTDGLDKDIIEVLFDNKNIALYVFKEDLEKVADGGLSIGSTVKIKDTINELIDKQYEDDDIYYSETLRHTIGCIGTITYFYQSYDDKGEIYFEVLIPNDECYTYQRDDFELIREER